MELNDPAMNCRSKCTEYIVLKGLQTLTRHLACFEVLEIQLKMLQCINVGLESGRPTCFDLRSNMKVAWQAAKRD